MAEDVNIKQNYLNRNILELHETIKEFDIKEAGFNLIKQGQLLDDTEIIRLENNFTKKERTIEIGKLMRTNKDLSKNLMKSFIEIRDIFYKENNLKKEDILAIKKDAIFVIKKKCNQLKFGDYIEFSLKNKFSSYYYINKYEFYYNEWNDILDVKGINNEHALIKYIKPLIKLRKNQNNKLALIRSLKKLIQDYKTYNLETECYREIDASCMFKLKLLDDKENENYKLQRYYYFDTFNMDLKYLDISYNYVKLLVPLCNLFI